MVYLVGECEQFPISFHTIVCNVVVTEVEIAAGVVVMQDILYIYCLLESLERKIELVMVLKMDNSRAVDIVNSWSDHGRTCHYFLHKLKDQILLTIRHIQGDSNDMDIFMKNAMSAMFNRYVALFVRSNKYLQEQDQASSREAVRG